MGTIGKLSRDRLNTCHHDIQMVVEAAVKIVDLTVMCGHRDKVAQDAAVAAKRSKTPWPTSKHNSYPALAVDVAPYDGNAHRPLWGDQADIDAMAFAYNKDKAWAKAEIERRWQRLAGAMLGAAAALGVPMRWGGDWDRDGLTHDETFVDLPHFEMIESKPIVT